MHRVATPKLLAVAAVTLVAIALVIESQTRAFVGDESFHLLAAKLIAAGRTPYRDFFYQHPPLYIYLVAGMFRLAGVGWRVVHLFSSAFVVGASVLVAMYARDFFVDENLRWRNAALAALLLGVNCYVLVFATTGLPFGFCLFCLSAALYLSQSRTNAGLYFSGIFGGAAAMSSLLALPVIPVFVVWLWRRERANMLRFVAGAATAFLPLLLLLVIAPERALVDVFKYHLADRPTLGWRYDLREILGWAVSLQGLILLVLAVAAVRIRKDDGVRLCAWLALVLILSLGVVKTTTSFYFLLTTPFLAILAATSVTEATKRLPKRSSVLAASVVLLYLIGLYGLRRVWRWEAPYFDYRDVALVASEAESCATGGNYYAPEAVYFMSRQLPPPGMENRFDPSDVGNLSLEQGRFEAVLINAGNPKINVFQLRSRYAREKIFRFDDYSMLLLCDKTLPTRP